MLLDDLLPTITAATAAVRGGGAAAARGGGAAAAHGGGAATSRGGGAAREVTKLLVYTVYSK